MSGVLEGPIRGCLDVDDRVLRIGPAGSVLHGWALDGDVAARAVRLRVDGQIWASAVLGDGRPDVVSALGPAVAGNCGWRLALDPSDLVIGGRYRATVEAMAADGRCLEIDARDLVVVAEDTEQLEDGKAVGEVHLDHPTQGARLDDETVQISGWVISESAPIDTVEVLVDGEPVGVARCFLPRPDVARAFHDLSQTFAGFEFSWTRDRRARKVTIEIRAVGRDGRRIDRARCDVELLASPGDEDAPDVGFFPRSPLSRTSTPEVLDGPSPLKVLVATHSLGIGGGQLWLTTLLEGLQRDPRIRLSVMSLGDGDLREDLQAEGIPVHLTGGLGGGAAEVYECRVQELACVIERQDCDVVLCNTIDTFFIAHAAERVGLPVVWAVHEHFDLAQWWPYRSDRIQGSFAFHSFYEALRAADRLVFEAEATRSLYREMLGSDNGTVIYYGIDTAGIDEYRQRFSKSELRAAIGVPDDATVVLNMGMFEPRKAQAMIVDVFSRLASRHDDLVLLLVGAGENPYTESLESFVEALDLGADRVIMKPASRDVWGYYGAADLLIGAADIESMPRSFMEAMAFGLPIITTDVAGCKELVFDGVSGWTCPIRTAGGLELAWERALLSPEVWPQFAAAGRDLLERRHVNEAHARKVAQLLHDVARRRR